MTTAKKIAAAIEFKKEYALLPVNDIICFTDGSCLKNPGPGGCGIVILAPFLENKTTTSSTTSFTKPSLKRIVWREFSKSLGPSTNNIAELSAIQIALTECCRFLIPKYVQEKKISKINIITDSTYCIGVLSKNWTPKVNQELIAEIKQLIDVLQNDRNLKIVFIWSPGHCGIEYNERVDVLAKQGASNK